MPDADFTIESLAEYLHVAPAQVMKLVERGRLPGRRIGGEWRFSSSEIHHWLEERIGLSTDEELQHMESALGRIRGGDDLAVISITDMLPETGIAVPLAARTRRSLIGEMAEVAARTGWLWDADKMAEAVRAREELMPTALDSGVALLHPRRPLSSILDRALLAFGRCDRGLPFGNPRGVLTDLFFLVCSTDDRTHLRTLARLSRLLSDTEFLPALREAPDAASVHRTVVSFEERLS
jgi:nitrogen PTS system EIIA component